MIPRKPSFSRETNLNKDNLNTFDFDYLENESKTQNTTSFLSIIESERRNRNDYEDLDKIQPMMMPSSSSSSSSQRSTTAATTKMNENLNFYVSNSSVDKDFSILDLSTCKENKFPVNRILNEEEQKQCDEKEYRTTTIMENSKLYRNNVDNFLFIIYACFYALFLIIGGLVFHFLETPIEQQIRENYLNIKRKFLQRYPDITDDDLAEFLNQVIKASKRGISPIYDVQNESNWNFGQAIFFSSTIITTIGYGHVTPLSETGKVFCIIYAAIGIPLTVIFLNAIVEKLIVPAKWLFTLLERKFGHLCEVHNIHMLHFSVIAVCIGTLFFILPTAIFNYLEPSWSVLDSFYFCFISMTTIGLGDYVPGQNHHAQGSKSTYKIFTTIYLILGLAAVTLASTVFYDIPSLDLTKLFTKKSSNCEDEKRMLLKKTGLNNPKFGYYDFQLSDETIMRLDEEPKSVHQYTRIH